MTSRHSGRRPRPDSSRQHPSPPDRTSEEPCRDRFADDGGRRVLVVVPAHDEADTVGEVVAGVRAAVTDADVLVVDDGSGDATAAAARAAGARVAQLPYNLGVGGAMRTGFRFAARHGYRVVVQVDADGQHDPGAIPDLLDALGRIDGNRTGGSGERGADVVIGARFAGRGDYPVGGARRLAMALLARVLSRAAGRQLTDVTSGFRAHGPRAIQLFAADYPVEYLGDTVESLLIAARRGLVVTQVPVVMRRRAGGAASQGPLTSAAYLARALIVLALAVIRRPVEPDIPSSALSTPDERSQR